MELLQLVGLFGGEPRLVDLLWLVGVLGVELWLVERRGRVIWLNDPQRLVDLPWLAGLLGGSEGGLWLIGVCEGSYG